MVNTVFSGQPIINISIGNCNRNGNGSTNTVNSNTIQSGTINKYMKLMNDYIDQLHLGKDIPYNKIGDALDVIMKYLYDSSLTNNSYSHKVLIYNTLNAVRAILEEMDGILGNTGNYVFLSGILSDAMRSLLDGSNIAQSNIVDTLNLTKENIRVFLQKIQNNDLNPFDDYKRQIIQYDKMKQLILNSLNLYITYFKEGNFSKLKEEFTETEWNEIGQKLISDTLFVITQKEVDDYTNTNQLFDQYRSFIFQLIDGLKASLLLENTNKCLVNSNKALEEFSNILKDPVLLNEYIAKNYNKSDTKLSLFSETIELTTSLELKPEYAKYIELYGFPASGIYDSEKLYKIIQSL